MQTDAASRTGMITIANNFRLGVRPEDIISALRAFTKRYRHRHSVAVGRAKNRDYYRGYNAGLRAKQRRAQVQ